MPKTRKSDHRSVLNQGEPRNSGIPMTEVSAQPTAITLLNAPRVAVPIVQSN